MLNSSKVKAKAQSLGFTACGIAPAENFVELRFLKDWIRRGFSGEMQYMARTADKRSDVRNVLPSARTVIALATLYNVDRPYSTEQADPNYAHVSRYAWGADYHEILNKRMEELLKWMRATTAESFEAKVYVDTGPVQERVYAQQAGLGWIGKNTCLISPELGSWLFLSEIICSLSLETDSPALDQCGECNLCLEACPTDAIVQPWALDATKCISYFTIELRDEIPESSREKIGTHVYGCDICQDVCPWNAQAETSEDSAWQPNAVFDQTSLSTLWSQSDEVLQPIVKKGAMSRAGLRGLRRNTAVALGNSGLSQAKNILDEPVHDSRTDPLVKRHVIWARNQLESDRKE